VNTGINQRLVDDANNVSATRCLLNRILFTITGTITKHYQPRPRRLLWYECLFINL
jgi:hypothetical protein